MYNLNFRKTEQLMVLFPWSAGGKQLAGAATVLSWLQAGALLLFMAVHYHMVVAECGI